jgi:hypothetical protein
MNDCPSNTVPQNVHWESILTVTCYLADQPAGNIFRGSLLTDKSVGYFLPSMGTKKSATAV